MKLQHKKNSILREKASAYIITVFDKEPLLHKSFKEIDKKINNKITKLLKNKTMKTSLGSINEFPVSGELNADYLFVVSLGEKKKFNIDINRDNININFCGFDWIILLSESVGINPPAEIKLILRFKELNILTCEMFNNKKKPTLGGKQGIHTAIFTDIQDFSTLSEQLNPQKLVELLNEYLTAMTDILLKNKGTLDKYWGDAIIAFFGAPVELNDQEYLACITCCQMNDKLEELRQKWKSEGDRSVSYTHLTLPTKA